MRRVFVVLIDMPDGCPVPAMEAHIEDAISTWGKQYHPDDPRFELDKKDVHVFPIPNPRERRKT